MDKCGNTVIHNSHCTFHFIKLGAQNICYKQPIFLKIMQQIKIYEKLQEILSNCHVSCNMIISVVHGQVSNMQACAQHMKSELGWESIDCAAHHIQMCIEDGLKMNTIERLLGACRRLVTQHCCNCCFG